MAHFAQIDDSNNVIQVLVVNNDRLIDESNNESEQKGIDFLKSLFGNDTKWVQTSYNGNFRGKYAGIGDLYDEPNDVFVTPNDTDIIE